MALARNSERKALSRTHASPISAKAAQIIKSEGYDFAGRYLVPMGMSKAIWPREAEDIRRAGLGLLLVWEIEAERIRRGADVGRADGESARELAHEIGAPAGTIIYFAADYGVPPEDYGLVEEYLRAASVGLGEYGCGVYGHYFLIEAMNARDVCRGYWQCVGWSCGKHSPARTVYQALWSGADECKALAEKVGFDVDIDLCEDMERAGLWLPETEEKEDETAPSEKRYNTMAEVPDWARQTILGLIAKGCIQGSGTAYDEDGNPADMDLSHDMIRLLVMNDRAGVYKD